jgi:hypothetical protein
MDNVEIFTKEVEGTAKKTAADVQSAFETYQRKLMDIATENMAFAMEFGHAMAATRSPTDFMTVTSDFTRRRLEMFQKHTNELMAITAAKI